jgi:hypothetical protein
MQTSAKQLSGTKKRYNYTTQAERQAGVWAENGAKHAASRVEHKWVLAASNTGQAFAHSCDD